MATSMDMHPVRQPLFQLDDNRRVDLPITRRLPPLHVQESHHSNAYSNLMPITSLVHSPSRGEERRKSSFDTFDHRSDSKASQQSSDDSFSVYVEHRVRESTPQQQRSDAMSNDEHRSHSQTRHDRVYQTREAGERASHDGEEQDRSWPTVIDHEKEDEISSNQSIQSQGSLRPGDSQEQYDEEEMECDGDAAGEKKKRRRTNKAEANVLASVFSQTQFPDAHTREALAKRLNMKPKAVSIWFQNRRQAMKKRASRFGGVEGVNGPTVTAATMQVLDVEGAQQGAPGSKELEMERLQKWMTLDDVVTAGDHSDKSMAHRPDQTVEEEQSDRTGDADVSFSSAPILDFICQQRGQQQLSRMASMPSLASIMSAKGGAAKPNGSLKDLRDLLPLHRGRLPLIRASSASALPVVGLEESSAAQEGAVVQSRLNHASSITKAVESKQSSAAGSQCTVVGGKVAFPTMLAQVLQSRGLEVPKQGANIWQRMQSSSSSSDGVTSSPDSNKENRDPNVPRPRREEDADEDEDEEKTLRMIAGRRAAKESAKKERKLSEMGKKYIEEADARVALQQKKRSSFSGHSAGQQALGKGPAPASAYSAQRCLVRAASDAHAFRANRNPMVLVRVPSLELTAGRDRAKDDGTSPSQSMMDLRLAKRPAPIEQDENADASLLHHRVKKAGKLSQQPARQQAHGRMPLQNIKNVQAKSSGVSSSRPFAPSRSLPVSTATLSMSRLGAHHTRHVLGTSSSRFEGPRESSARFDGQDWHSASSSQEDSENGSDEWLEAWAREKRRPTVVNAGALRERSAAVLNSEATRQERKRSAQMTHPTPRHDDSGFYGSESGLEDECDDDIIVEKRSSKRRLLSQGNSSSPLKRGDERDRLAAETLLGLGSRA